MSDSVPPNDPARYVRWTVDDARLMAMSSQYRSYREVLIFYIVVCVVLTGLATWAFIAGTWWSVSLGVLALLLAVGAIALGLYDRDEAWRPFKGGPLLPGLVTAVRDGEVKIVVLAELSQSALVAPRFAVRAFSFPAVDELRWLPGTRVPCVGYGFSGDGGREAWGTFSAAPLAWATADQRSLVDAQARIEAAEWDFLAYLAPLSGEAMKGESNSATAIDAARLPAALRFPRSRFGVRVIWDPSGDPYPVPDEPAAEVPATVVHDRRASMPSHSDDSVFVAEGPVRRGTVATRHLYFQADPRHARKYNEEYRGNSWFFVTPTLLAVCLAAAATWLFVQGRVWSIVVGAVATAAAVLCAWAARWAFKNIGRPHDFFGRGLLNPAIIVDVRSNGATLMVLAEMTAEPSVPVRYALATREVRHLPGHRLEVGEKIPVTCSFGVYSKRPHSREGYWDMVNPVPLAWGTPDQDVLAQGVAAIDAAEWDFLARNMRRYPLIAGAPEHTVLLAHEELPEALRRA